LGREIAPGRITFPSSEGIYPRLLAFFSSRFVVVEAGQSPGMDPATELDGAGGAGARGGAWEALLFGGFGEDLAAAPLLAALVARVEIFFFPILQIHKRSGFDNGGAVVLSAGDE
jgi:hypothetical protein